MYHYTLKKPLTAPTKKKQAIPLNGKVGLTMLKASIQSVWKRSRDFANVSGTRDCHRFQLMESQRKTGFLALHFRRSTKTPLLQNGCYRFGFLELYLVAQIRQENRLNIFVNPSCSKIVLVAKEIGLLGQIYYFQSDFS